MDETTHWNKARAEMGLMRKIVWTWIRDASGDPMKGYSSQLQYESGEHE